MESVQDKVAMNVAVGTKPSPNYLKNSINNIIKYCGMVWYENSYPIVNDNYLDLCRIVDAKNKLV